MSFFLQMAFLASLTSVLIFWAPQSHSQDYVELASPQARLTEKDYLSILSSFSVDEVRSAISEVWKHGLNPRAYWSDDMERIYSRGGSSQLQARATSGLYRLLRDISIGVMDPGSVANDIKLRRKSFVSPEQMRALIITSGQKANLLIDGMAPKTAPYVALKNALEKIYPVCVNGQWVAPARPKKTLRLGVQDPAVVSLKRHFSFLGYSIPNFNDVVDQDTVNAINDIEWNMHIKPDSTMSPDGKVWNFLSTPCMVRVRQLQADMEKMRWFPQQFEDRYIFINLAMSYFVMVDKTQSPAYITSFRTIVGRTERKTPTMRDKIVRVILNPYWIVPPTIFIEDKVQEIRELNRSQIRHYFESKNYEVWNESFTKRIDPESINWWAFNSADDASIYIRQRPNYWNALGVVKFELTNSMSIYLHDTNQRELFWEAQRQISSGCIRLEKPLDLAEYLLRGTEWDRAKIDGFVSKPGEVKSKDTPVRLDSPMPVYTVSLTSFLGSDGIIRFVDDSYGQNKNILKNLIAL